MRSFPNSLASHRSALHGELFPVPDRNSDGLQICHALPSTTSVLSSWAVNGAASFPEGTVWSEIKVARDIWIAEAWKELFENQGIPCQIWPMDSRSHGVALTAYQVLVPNDRVHVADLVLSHTF
jgi:hypothetical protein